MTIGNRSNKSKVYINKKVSVGENLTSFICENFVVSASVFAKEKINIYIYLLY